MTSPGSAVSSGSYGIGVGAVDRDRGQAVLARVGDVLDGETPRMAVRGAAGEDPSGRGGAGGRNGHRESGRLEHPQNQHYRCGHHPGQAQSACGGPCTPQADTLSPSDDLLKRNS
jgi:hypothetical protein